MKDIPNWVVPVAVVAVGILIMNRLKAISVGAGKIAQETGEKISSNVFDFLNPQFRPENYNKPTVVNAQMMNGKYVCPKGYRYKLTLRNEHLCFRED